MTTPPDKESQDKPPSLKRSLWVALILLLLVLWGVVALKHHKKPEKAYDWVELRKLEKQVLALEQSGQRTQCARQILSETQWLTDSTPYFDRIASRMQDLRDLLKKPASQDVPDEQSASDGSWGHCYTEWFFKLDASYNEIAALADSNQVPKVPCRFLDRINSPEKLTNHLNQLLISDIEADGVDRGREFNETVSDLFRLVLRHQPANYPFHPQLKDTFFDFLMNRARNPKTGYWGEWFKTGNTITKVDRLSITFHIISYLKGDVTDWPKVIDTTLAIKNKRYPNGWLSSKGYVNHHNMDVVVLFRYGWPHATPAQQAAIRTELHKMLDWCLKDSLQPDGSFRSREEESLEESAHFGTAFLAQLGYFDKSRRFWTDEDFPAAPVAKERIATYIRAHLTSGGEGGSYYRNALADLGEKAPPP